MNDVAEAEEGNEDDDEVLVEEEITSVEMGDLD